MPIHRARQKAINLTGGGGGGPAPTGNFVIGPDYGSDSGNDGTTLGVQAAIALDQVNMAGSLGVNSAIDLASIDLAGNLGVNTAIDLAEVNLAGSLGVGVAVASSVVIDGMLADEDTYLDRANADTTFGSATGLLAKNNTAVVNDDKNTYIAWDLTGISTGTVTAANMDLFCSENGVGGANFDYEIFTHPTQPIDESADTWNNNEPPSGTSRQSGTINVNSASPVLTTITLDSTTRANMLGNWLYVRLAGTDNGLGTVTLTTQSKESAGNEPTLDMSLDL